MPQFQKIKILPNLFHGNNQGVSSSGISCCFKLESFFNMLQKDWEMFGQWRSDLLAIELGINYSNIYGKISAAL